MFGVGCLVAMLALSLGCRTLRPATLILGGPSLAGYVQEGPVQAYNENTLFDYIDGEAELYFARGFQLLYVLTYRNNASGNLYILDAYDLGTPERARAIHESFTGRYSSSIQGVPDATTDGLTAQLNLGRFFIRVQPDQTVAEPSEEELIALAKAVHASFK